MAADLTSSAREPRTRSRVRPVLGRSVRIAAASLLTAAIAQAAVARWTTTGPSSPGIERIVVDPRSPQRLYAAANQTLQLTLDGGRHWRWINPSRGTDDDSVYGFAVDPFEPDTLLAGRVFGLVRSEDGGLSWSGFIPFAPADADALVLEIAASQSRPGTFYFYTRDALYRTDDDADHSTRLTWPAAVETALIALAVDPTDADTVFVSVFGEGVFRSRDGGAHWSSFGVGLPEAPSQIVVNPADPSRVYAVTGSGQLFATSGGTDLWASIGPVGEILRCFAVDPADSARLLAGGDGVFESRNGGVSWTRHSVGPTPLNSDVFVSALGAASGELYAGTFEGFFRSENGGASWTAADDGLPENGARVIDATSPNTIYATGGRTARRKGREPWVFNGPFNASSLASDPTGSIVYAGTGGCTYPAHVPPACSGTLYESQDGGDSWAPVLDGGAIFAVAVDPARPLTAYASVGTVGVTTPISGTIQKTVDAGVHWTGLALPQSFVAMRILVDPKRLDAVFATDGSGVMRSFDGGAHWQASSTDFPGPIEDLARDPSNDTVLYAATVTGVFRSFDSGETWQLTGLYQEADTVAVDGSGVVYAGSFNSVLRSSDSGATWSSLSVGLHDAYLFMLRIDPAGSVLYAGTDRGVFEFDFRRTRPALPRLGLGAAASSLR